MIHVIHPECPDGGMVKPPEHAPMPLFNHFDMLAPFYDRVMSPREDERLGALMDLPVGEALLDVGGGTGRASRTFAQRASQVIVADESHSMLLQSADKVGLSGVTCAAEALPFASSSFAGVIIVDALHHLADQEMSLQEMWRVLAPGGRLIIEEPDIGMAAVKIVALFEKLALMRSHFMRAEESAELLAALGAQTRIRREGHSVWVLADKPVTKSSGFA
jgi:demethylmenaquinone methyltransferase/2-methoxy-6-polyprenyl-1,4-benzoquinol methylase